MNKDSAYLPCTEGVSLTGRLRRERLCVYRVRAGAFKSKVPNRMQYNDKKPPVPDGSCRQLSVFPINDSARVQLYVIMPIRLQTGDDLNHQYL